MQDNELASAVSRMEHKLDYAIAKTAFTILPGTKFSRYLMPLEYLPSRAYQPRWGNTHPPIPQIASLLERHADSYRHVLRRMRALAPKLSSIPTFWDEGAQPMPCWAGTPLNAFDSVLVYTMMERYRPKKYLEVGSGMSTLFAHRAKVDFDIDTHITSIDPQPRSEIDVVCDVIIREALENTSLDPFFALEAGDILFMDGSHRSFANSDVTIFMIDILPNLKPGVIVHVHDIGLPTDYAGFALDWYWNEQYLLACYMIGAGDKVKPLLPASFIGQRPELFPEHHDAGPILELGEWNAWHSGGSFWFTQS